MKKRLLSIISVISIIFISAFFQSCELEDCATCEQIQTDADGTKTILATVTVCDEELDELENETPVTINNVTTEWVCE